MPRDRRARHRPRTAPRRAHAGREHSVEQAVTSVGDRALEDRGFRQGAADASRQGVGDLTWPERPLEGGRRDQDKVRHNAGCVKSGILLREAMLTPLLQRGCDAGYGWGTVFAAIPRQHSSVKGKPPATAGRKAQGSRAVVEIARLPEVAPVPALAESAAREFASLTSGSRAHGVGQAITPQGQLWGVVLLGNRR